MPARIFADLHVHTRCSDGALAPAALVERAHDHGVQALAVTDHDTVAGLEAAARAGKQRGMEIIAGIEFSATLDGEEMHLLGYFFDPEHEQVQAAIERMREGRRQRARRMVARLQELGISLPFEAVEEQARDASAITRPHVAEALVEAGHVDNWAEAFGRFLGDDGPAFVAKPDFPASQALDVLHAAGGIGVLAHPGQWTSEAQIERLVEAGLDGLEARHPSHPPWLTRYYKKQARRLGLIWTGGSDYHGYRERDAARLGQYGVPRAHLDRLRRRDAGLIET